MAGELFTVRFQRFRLLNAVRWLCIFNIHCLVFEYYLLVALTLSLFNLVHGFLSARVDSIEFGAFFSGILSYVCEWFILLSVNFDVILLHFIPFYINNVLTLFIALHFRFYYGLANVRPRWCCAIFFVLAVVGNFLFDWMCEWFYKLAHSAHRF